MDRQQALFERRGVGIDEGRFDDPQVGVAVALDCAEHGNGRSVEQVAHVEGVGVAEGFEQVDVEGVGGVIAILRPALAQGAALRGKERGRQRVDALIGRGLVLLPPARQQPLQIALQQRVQVVVAVEFADVLDAGEVHGTDQIRGTE